MSIRVGILGTANIAKRSLAPAFINHPDFELVAVASRTKDKGMAFIGELACTQGKIVSMSYDQLVSSQNLDLVYCPLPTGLHHDWVQKCMTHGKHVLCEKSLACSEAEVTELIGIARRENCFLMESFQFRFHAQNLYVRSLLKSGRIGKIRCVRASFGFPPFPDGTNNIRYRKSLGGGALLDVGAYTIKAATYLMGRGLELCAAESWTEPGYEVDLGGSITLRSIDGVPAQLAYGFDNFYQCSYDIWGEKGRVTTARAFTARADFPAEVCIEDETGRHREVFVDDHFTSLLNHVAKTISSGKYEEEYMECQEQSRIMEQVRKAVNK